jgi:hypothetical protein
MARPLRIEYPGACYHVMKLKKSLETAERPQRKATADQPKRKRTA